MTMEEVKPETAQVAEPVKASESKIEESADAATIEENKKKTEESESAAEENKTEEEEALKVSNKAVESNFLSDLKDAEKKALAELKAKLEEAIVENKLFRKEDPKQNQEPKEEVKKEDEEEPKDGEQKTKEEEEEEAETKAEVEEETDKVVEQISLWGVPLFPSKNSDDDDATDVLLLKFLRAREFKVRETLDMLKNTLQWRRDNKIDSVLEETELGNDFGAACYMEGLDREGHPVCYNVSAVFQEEEVYKKAFGSKEGRERFLRWRVQLMEKGIQKLDMRPGGISKLLQITDLKDSVGPSKKKELRDTMKQALQVLQDNYPEFVTRNIFINVPFWYYAFYALLSPFMTQRTKNKFVISRSSNVTETLLKHIPAEAIPIQYGGFKRENDTVFFSLEDDPVSELIVKASSTETIEIAAPKAGTTAVWDLTVLGWDVKYKEEFVPSDEGSYTIILQKVKKMGSQEELIRNSFMNNEPGKIVLTVENNNTSKKKKKKVLFRYKTDK